MSMFDDLDELYQHMRDEVAYILDNGYYSDTTRSKVVVDRLVYFTKKLCTAMEVMG